MEITLQEAYAEACTALGETIIRERMLAKQLAASRQQISEDGNDEKA